MSKVFITSDTHFGHTNIIKYCNRPFTSAEEMDEQLIKNWNSVVGPDDVVIHCGDFALYHDKEKIAEVVQRLNGRKILILGNHDHHTANFYKRCGFIHVVGQTYVQVGNCVFSHYPPIAPHDDCIYFFGHVHDKPAEVENRSNCHCVCCERSNLTPIELSVELIENEILRQQLSWDERLVYTERVGSSSLSWRTIKDNSMTLEEAIEHLKEKIPQINCESCRKEHQQLLEWLQELQSLRNSQVS